MIIGSLKTKPFELSQIAHYYAELHGLSLLTDVACMKHNISVGVIGIQRTNY
jgi:hypothetical protein